MNNLSIAILVILILVIYFYDDIKIMLLNFLVVSRGMVSPNCSFWNISDLLLKDSNGIHLYQKYKSKYGDFAPVSMFGEKMYMVTNVKYIKTILDNSPNLFGVGKLKKNFFKSFMDKNVGVSQGCPWKKRREINEKVLYTNELHAYHKKYAYDTASMLKKYSKKKELIFGDFTNMGKYMVAKIVFNENSIPDDVFKVFAEANSVLALLKENYKIDPQIHQKYINFMEKHIQNPKEKSLVELYKNWPSAQFGG